MYVSMKPILAHASAHGYAVMAANAMNMEMARAVISAADEKQAPLIVIIGGMQMARHAAAALMAPMIRRLAEETTAPVALCLDHGANLQKVVYALNNGFSSIMLDGSKLPFEENAAVTKQVVELCHGVGVGVEGELGHVGMAADLDGRDASLYTSPEQAARFAAATGVDCLAVAIGTAHGKYPEGFVPQINFDLLRKIKAATHGMPIALHGGSGSGDENIRKAVAAGVNKINLATDLQNASREGAIEAYEAGGDYIQMIQNAELHCKELLMHWMELSGSCGQAKKIPLPYTFSRLQGDYKNNISGE
jgi:fructose-bisphosphate aldolase class II